MRSASRLFGLALAGVTLLTGCHMAPSATPRARLTGEGLVYVYLSPLSQRLDRLQVTLSSLQAVATDGTSIPLELQFDQLSLRRVGRERLLAVGTLPPDTYRGLEVAVAGAKLTGEAGAADLALPATPLAVAVPFSIGVKRAVVISLGLDDNAPVAEDYLLAATFSAQIPEQLTTGLIGVATSRAWNTLTIFDKQKGRVHAVIPTDAGTSGVAIDRVRLRAYVANPRDDVIQTIDLLSGRVIDRIQMQIGDRPAELILTADGRRLLTANAGSNTVSFLDAQALFEVGRLQVGNGPGAITLNPEGTKAYVFNRLSDSITILDVTARRIILTSATDAVPIRGMFDSRGATLYVIHEGSPYLTLFEPNLEIRERVFVGTGATALTLDPRTNRVYLARRGAGTVDVYDPSSLLPIDSIPTDSDVAYLAIDGELNNLAMLLVQAGSVRLIGLTNRDPVAEIDIGVEPYWVAFVGEG